MAIPHDRYITVELDLARALSGPGLRARLEAIAQLLQEQTLDRITEGGDDEIRFTPLDYDRPQGGKENPLYDTGTHLYNSITHGVDPDGPWVGSTFVGAGVQQFGTRGKGGELPTIRPVRAKALFIPLTPRAAKATKVGGERVYRGKGGKEGKLEKADPRFVGKSRGELKKAYREASKRVHPDVGGSMEEFIKVKKRYDQAMSGRYRPDFMLVSKVDIHPRPFLRVSERNRQELADTFADPEGQP